MSEIQGFNQQNQQESQNNSYVRFYIQNAIDFLEHPAVAAQILDLFKAPSSSLPRLLSNYLSLPFYSENGYLGRTNLSLYDLIDFKEDAISTYVNFVELLKGMLNLEEVFKGGMNELKTIEIPVDKTLDLSNIKITQKYTLLDDDYEVEVKGSNYTELFDRLDTVELHIIDSIDSNIHCDGSEILEAIKEKDYDEVYDILSDITLTIDGISGPDYTFKSTRIRLTSTRFVRNNLQALETYIDAPEEGKTPRRELKAKLELQNILNVFRSPALLLQPALCDTKILI